MGVRIPPSALQKSWVVVVDRAGDVADRFDNVATQQEHDRPSNPIAGNGMHEVIFVVVIVVSAAVIAAPLAFARWRRHTSVETIASDDQSDSEPIDAT